MPYKSKEDRAAAQDRYRERLRAVIAEAKSVGCIDCGEDDPVVLQFDHRDPAQKEFKIASVVGIGGMNRLLEELAKCDVRCANCHLKEHHRREHPRVVQW